MKLSNILTARALAQILSGGATYFVAVSVYYSVADGRFNAVAVLLFILSVSLAFIGLTILWHALDQTVGRGVPIEVNLLLGPILYLPIHFAAGPSVEELDVLTELWALLGGYLILPALIVTIQRIPIGWALDLLFISTLLTGALIRLRSAKRRRKEEPA